MKDRIFPKQLIPFLILLVAIIFIYRPAVAQTEGKLIIDQIDSSNFPQITVNLSILDERGFPYSGITASNISASEDGIIIPNIQLAPINVHPLQAVLLVDVSRTTEYGKKPTPFQSVIQTAGEFVGSLASDDQIAVVSFSDDVITHQNLTTDKQAAQRAITGLKTGAYSCLNDALVSGVKLLKGNSSRPIIILLVDGVDSGISKSSFEDALRLIQEEKVTVYPIAWGGANQNELKKLAEVSHGEVQFLQPSYPDEAAFEAAFNHILDLLPDVRLQYQFTYTSSLPADGNEHQLNIQLDYIGQHIEQARSFVSVQKELYITTPSLMSGQVVGGIITLAPKVDSPAPLSQLDILLDNTPLTSLVAEPFTFDWNTTNTLPGEHELTFIATDSAGNIGQTSLSLILQPPVIVKIISPTDGEMIESQVTLAADVTGLAKITKVDFSIDGKTFATLSAPPYEVEWSAVKASAGSHDIQVTALDVNGFSSQDSIRILVAAQEKSNVGTLAIVIAVAAGVGLLLVIAGVRNRKQSRSNLTSQDSTSDPGKFGMVTGGALRELQGINPGREWPLSMTAETTLGRKRDENDIPLAGKTSSRKHAIIIYQDGCYLLYNLRPENPIYLDGKPVIEQASLQAGSSLQIGDSVFEFVID